MRTRTGIGFLACCCAALTACTNQAPGESQYALTEPCMSAAGYPGVTFSDGIVSLPFSAAAGKCGAIMQDFATATQDGALAGIYFAVQASYEKQLVTANQQALSAAVSHYRAAYAKELKQLPALLRTAKAQPFHPARRSAGSRPSPAHS